MIPNWWVMAKERNLAMSCLLKNASSSFRESTLFLRIVENGGVLNVPERIAWLRHPQGRITSAYSHFQFYNNKGKNTQHKIPPAATKDYRAFIDFILEHENPHWQPQVELLTHEGVYVPTITERFEDLSHRFSHYLGGKLGISNTSVHLPVDLDYRRRDVAVKYRADYELWHSL